MPMERLMPGESVGKQIDCSLLIEPWHVFAQIAEALLGVTDRADSLQLDTPAVFVDRWRTTYRRGLADGMSPLLILHDAETLLRDDPMVLWTLLQLPTLLVHASLSRAVLCSS